MANDIVLETRGLVKKFGDAVILNSAAPCAAASAWFFKAMTFSRT